MRKNFRFGTVAMAAMIAASMAMSSPVVSHAEELDANSDVGDVLITSSDRISPRAILTITRMLRPMKAGLKWMKLTGLPADL